MTAASVQTRGDIPADRIVDINIYDPAPGGGDVLQAWKDLKARSRPLMWTTANGGHWLTTNGALLRAVLRDHKTFSSSIIMAPRETGGLSELIPITSDPPQHMPFRALINEHLSPQGVQKREASIRAHARELIHGFKPKGRCEFTGDFAQQLAIGSFFSIADLPMADFPMLSNWVSSMYHAGHTEAQVGESQQDIMQRFDNYLRPIVAARQKQPKDDLISAVSSGKINGKLIDLDDALKIVRTLVLAGLDTVMALMSFTMHYLAGDPALRRRLAETPTDIIPAIDEFARRFPIGINMRVTMADKEIDGMIVRKDDLIATPIILHALDETEYPDAEHINIDRESGGHTTFGVGIHRCAGTFLARIEMKVMLEEWLKEIPEFSVQPGETIRATAGFTSGIHYLPLCWPTANGARAAS